MTLIRAVAALLVLMLAAACSTLPSFAPGTPCITDGFTVSDGFQGARRGRCVVTGTNSVRIDNRKEDAEVINPSPWYAFRVEPHGADTASVTIRYHGARHRYLPKISRDGLSWSLLDETQVSVADNERSATLHLALDGEPVWIAAQELITPAVYDAWMMKMLQTAPVTQRVIGESLRGQPISAMTAGAGNDDVLLIVGRQHPPEVSGGIAFIAFAETLFADTELARRFRDNYRIIAVPLMNPDGVIGGNWRHNLGATDLNRDWGPFRQPETQLVKALLDDLDASGARVRAFSDFHSTNRNLVYTMNADYPTDPPGFTVAWLERAAARLGERYEFTDEAGELSDQANSKNYMYKRYGIPAVTYEVGDETERTAVREAAIVFAEELMSLLLCVQHQDDVAACE